MREKNYNAGLRGVLFEVKHYRQMGPAVWLYGWLVLRETRERDGIGFVLGGKPVSYREIEDETGFPRKSLERWMRILRSNGYIETAPASSGVIVQIQKAKKFLRKTGGNDDQRFPRVLNQSVEKLWKSSGREEHGLLKNAVRHSTDEEPLPQFCAKARGKFMQEKQFRRQIGSESVEREIEIQSEPHYKTATAHVENSSSSILPEPFFPLEKTQVSEAGPGRAGTSETQDCLSRLSETKCYQLLRAQRDEELGREVQAGPASEPKR
jgi:hypothetical protein